MADKKESRSEANIAFKNAKKPKNNQADIDAKAKRLNSMKGELDRRNALKNDEIPKNSLNSVPNKIQNFFVNNRNKSIEKLSPEVNDIYSKNKRYSFLMPPINISKLRETKNEHPVARDLKPPPVNKKEDGFLIKTKSSAAEDSLDRLSLIRNRSKVTALPKHLYQYQNIVSDNDEKTRANSMLLEGMRVFLKAPEKTMFSLKHIIAGTVKDPNFEGEVLVEMHVDNENANLLPYDFSFSDLKVQQDLKSNNSLQDSYKSSSYSFDNKDLLSSSSFNRSVDNKQFFVKFKRNDLLSIENINAEGIEGSYKVNFEDMLFLKSFNKAMILNVLKTRFEEKKYFTYCGSVLFFISPIKKKTQIYRKLFSEKKQIEYIFEPLSALDPHVYTLVRKIFNALAQSGKNQLLMVLGTESCGNEFVRRLIQYFFRFNGSEDANLEMSKKLKDNTLFKKYLALEYFLSVETVTYTSEHAKQPFLLNFYFDKSNSLIGANFQSLNPFTEYNEKVAHQYRREGERLQNITYCILYGIHKDNDNPLLSETYLHPVDITALLELLPLPYLPYEDLQHQAFVKLLESLKELNFTESEIRQFMRLSVAVIILDAISYFKKLRRNGKSKACTSMFINVVKDSPSTNKKFPQREVIMLAGRDVEFILSELLGVSYSDLKKAGIRYELQLEFLSLKLHMRLKLFLLYKFHEIVKVSNESDIASRISLIQNFGFDLKTNSVNSFIQLLRNYTEECIQSMFINVSYDINKNLYKEEEVYCPSIRYKDPKEVISLLSGDLGFFSTMRHYYLSGFKENEVNKNNVDESILKIFVKKAEKSQLFLRSESFTEPVIQNQTVEENSEKRKLTFMIKHTPGLVEYNAVGFFNTNMNAFVFDPELYLVLSYSSVPLLRLIIGAVPVNKELSENQYDFASKFRSLSQTLRSDFVENSLSSIAKMLEQKDLLDKPFFVALSNANPYANDSNNKNSALFDEYFVFQQLEQLQIMDYCQFENEAMLVHLSYSKVLSLYSILYIPNQYNRCTFSDSSEKYLKEVTLMLLSKLGLSVTDYQLGKTKVFFRKIAFMLLEYRRISYLRRAIPAAIRLQRGWKTFKERKLKDEINAISVRLQSHVRRHLLINKKKLLLPLKNLLLCFVLFYCLFTCNRKDGLNTDLVIQLEKKYREDEISALRHAAAVVIQSFWRSKLAKRKLATIKMEKLKTFCVLTIQNCWRRYKAQQKLFECVLFENLPNLMAVRIQSEVRRWIQQRKYRRLRGLAMSLMAIKRKGSYLYTLSVQLDYRSILKSRTSLKDLLRIQRSIPENIVKIQSLFRMNFIRKQYLTLREATIITQAVALTKVGRYEFLSAKSSIIKIQRWWRSTKILSNSKLTFAAAKAIKMPKKSFKFICDREKASFLLLRFPLLSFQGFFTSYKFLKKDNSFMHLLDFQLFRDIRNVYPITWSRPLLQICRKLKNSILSNLSREELALSSEYASSIKLQCLAIGGHHSLVLIGKYVRIDKDDFSTAVYKMNNAEQMNQVAGYFYTNSVYAWGWNDKGQLGNCFFATNNNSDSYVPNDPIKFVDQTFVKKTDSNTGHRYLELVREMDFSHKISWIGAGDDHSIALTANGLVFSWGDNSVGQCGQGHRVLRLTEPQIVETLRQENLIVVSASVGNKHCGVVTSDGLCLIWGDNFFVGLSNFPEGAHFYIPHVVPNLENCKVIQICCSRGFNVLQTKDLAGIYVWGRNDVGQLGLGTEETQARHSPVFLPIFKTIKNLKVNKICTGPDFVVVCVHDLYNKLFAWGKLLIFFQSFPADSAEQEKTKVYNNLNLFKFETHLNRKKEVKVEQPNEKNKSFFKKYAIRQPSLISHSLWIREKIVDVACSPDTIAVLTHNGNVYGFNFMEVKSKKKVKVEKISNERQNNFSYSLRSVIPETKNEPSISEKLESELKLLLKGEYTLEPSLFQFKNLRPSCMTAASVHSSYNLMSCLVFWTQQNKLEMVLDKNKQNVFTHKTVTGDVFNIPISSKIQTKSNSQLLQDLQSKTLPMLTEKAYIPKITFSSPLLIEKKDILDTKSHVISHLRNKLIYKK